MKTFLPNKISWGGKSVCGKIALCISRWFSSIYSTIDIIQNTAELIFFYMRPIYMHTKNNNNETITTKHWRCREKWQRYRLTIMLRDLKSAQITANLENFLPSKFNIFKALFSGNYTKYNVYCAQIIVVKRTRRHIFRYGQLRFLKLFGVNRS